MSTDVCISGRSAIQQRRRIRGKPSSRLPERNLSTSKPSDKGAFSSSEPLTLLHKTTNWIHRIPRYSVDKEDFGIPNAVDSVLSKAYDDLSATTERPVKVAICGIDQWSGTEDLITALLSDPLSSDVKEINALNDRWKDPSLEKIEFRHKSTPDIPPSSFISSSSYLTQFSVPIDICEIRPPKSSQHLDHVLQRILWSPAFVEADIPILVLNPLTTPVKSILNTPFPTNGVIILSSTSISQSELSDIVGHEQDLLPHPQNHSNIPIIPINPSKAVQAIRTIQSSPNSLSAIQQYQDGFIDSGVSKIGAELKRKLQLPSLNTLRRKNALFKIKDLLSSSLAGIQETKDELDKAFTDTSVLKEDIEKLRAQIEANILGEIPDEDGTSLRKHEDVDEAISRAEREMKPVMDRLTWWRIVGRVDEITNIVGSAIMRTWCTDLEKRLILQTGYLSSIQSNIDKSALHLLVVHPVITTAVLRNTLLRSKTSPSRRLATDALTKPLVSRRNQILEYPTTRLHVDCQKVVFGIAGGVFGGVGISWAGWLGWLVGSEGLVSFLGMNASTAMGVGILTAIASIRWGVGKWERAKLRWWQDWTRIGQGLDRDLKASIHKVMDKQVVVVGDIACKEISELIQSRQDELVKIQVELKEVRRGVDVIIGSLMKPPESP